MERVWQEGGGIADIPPQADVPVPTEQLCLLLYRTRGTQLLCHGRNPMVRSFRSRLWSCLSREPQPNSRLQVQLRKALQANRELHALRCDFELKLGVAQKNRDEVALYFPHNIDFRGRAYTMHPYLNHLGSDVVRGLLLFAQPRPLGERGLVWLRIQVANLFGGGVDKKCLEERERFAVANMARISESAVSPLDGERWWMQAEDPWQCLAACIELHEAMCSLDPAAFESRLPVHQDGSCNGLQHYAALARDLEGGRAVNLLPGPEPADVYRRAAAARGCASMALTPRRRGIANLVTEAVLKDSLLQSEDPVHGSKARPCATRPALGSHAQPPPQVSQASRLVGHVDRKLVKQTVMTSVYGVTFMGARDQIFNRRAARCLLLHAGSQKHSSPRPNRLKERKAFDSFGDNKQTAMYAAREVLEALGDMFENARSVMDWLNECAREIAKDGESMRLCRCLLLHSHSPPAADESVRWRTPIGLPVVQVRLQSIFHAASTDRPQPYRKPTKRSVQTVLQTFAVLCVPCALSAAAPSDLGPPARTQATSL